MNLETQSDFVFWHGSGRDHDKSWRQEPAGRRIINSGVVETLDMGMCRGNGEPGEPLKNGLWITLWLFNIAMV